MENEMDVQDADGTSDLDIDFSVTESGRTVAHVVQGKISAAEENIGFSITSSGRTLSGSDMEVFNAEDAEVLGALVSGDEAVPVSKSIPVPQDSQRSQSPNHHQSGSQQNQASSQGSSGSAFLSSVLNPAASTFGNSQLSHTPPAASSYEVSHFGKRSRSGSVSGRLRSASEYLEDKGLLDRHTRGILKDLIIIGDEELQVALDSYDAGDPSKLEEMISSGALQKRLPQDLDILGDLDMDFLALQDGDGDLGRDNIEPLPDSSSIQSGPPITVGSEKISQSATVGQPNTVSPQYDGIGDLDFTTGDFADSGDYNNHNNFQSTSFSSSRQPSATASPADQGMTEIDRRMRSNSLFSALLDPRSGSGTPQPLDSQTDSMLQYGQWMDRTLAADALHRQGITIRDRVDSDTQMASQPTGGIGASLEAEKKRQGRKQKKEQKKKEKAEKKKKGRNAQTDDDIVEEHVPGSGRPRSLSDPNLRTSYDGNGFMVVDRPDGWVGAYSPDSRKVRIEKFLAKRNNRVWTKTVKYDVRKNFADSRLRVKGRFVKKGDELLMRELMSLT